MTTVTATVVDAAGAFGEACTAGLAVHAAAPQNAAANSRPISDTDKLAALQLRHQPRIPNEKYRETY